MQSLQDGIEGDDCVTWRQSMESVLSPNLPLMDSCVNSDGSS
jgi:hypothetical protein